MPSVLCDTELRPLLPRPNARVVGRDYSMHFTFFSLMLLKSESGIRLQAGNI